MAKEIRSYFWRGLAYAIVLEAMLVGAVLYWPIFERHIGVFKALIPFKAIREAVDLQGYVVLQHFFKGCNILGTAAAVLFAVGAVAGEAQRGTMEIWLARPVSRARLLVERYALGALALALPVVATTATIPWLLGYVDQRMELRPLLLCALHQSLFLAVVYSATFWLSSMGSRPTVIAFLVLSLTVFEFSLYLIERATYWSFFRLADIEVFQAIFATGALDAQLTWIFAGLCSAFLAASWIAFRLRVP